MSIKIKQNKNYISYEVTITLPLELQKRYNKQRLYKTFGKKEEAEKWEKKKYKEIEEGEILFIEKKTIKEIGNDLLEENKNTWSINSINTFKGFINNYFYPVFNDKKIDSLNENDLKRFKDKLNNENITNKTKHNISSGFRTLVKFALDKGYIEEDMLDKMPKYSQKRTKNKDFLTLEQLKSLIEIIDNKDAKDFITILSFTGLRISELCGLRFCNIDFEDSNIIVKDQILYSNNGNYSLKNPKCNYSSTIKCNSIVMNILKEYKQLKNPNDNDFVFTDKNNKPFRKDGYIKYQFDNAIKILKNNGAINKDSNISLHSLRHSYGSLLAHHGEKLHVIQSLLRHQNFKVTYDTYVHMYQDEKPKSFNEIEQAYKLKN